MRIIFIKKIDILFLGYTVTKYNVAEDHVFESVLPTSEELEKLTGITQFI